MAKKLFVLLLAVCLMGVLTGCRVTQTEEGEMPKVDVDVDAEKGNLPKYDVDGPDIDVNTEEKTMTVPDVDIDVNEKEVGVTVPDIDVKTPDDPDYVDDDTTP